MLPMVHHKLVINCIAPLSFSSQINKIKRILTTYRIHLCVYLVKEEIEVSIN